MNTLILAVSNNYVYFGHGNHETIEEISKTYRESFEIRYSVLGSIKTIVLLQRLAFHTLRALTMSTEDTNLNRNLLRKYIYMKSDYVLKALCEFIEYNELPIIETNNELVKL